MNRRLAYLLPLLCVLSLWIPAAKCTSSLRGRRESVGTRGTITCRVTVMHTLFLNEQSKETSPESTVCIPRINGEEGHESFAINVNLPRQIHRNYDQEIEEGTLVLSISNAAFDGDSISTTEESDFVVGEHVDDDSQRLRRNTATNPAMGRRTLAVVTVGTTNGQVVSYSHDMLRKYLFEAKHSMYQQYRRCSLDQIHWESAGFFDVVLEGDLEDHGSPAHARNAALQKLVDDNVVQESAQELADNVMVILPKGTTGLVANAGMNYWLSTFNDVWSLDLSTVIHELAHNLGKK